MAWLVEEKPTLLDLGRGRGRLLLLATALGAAAGMGIDISEKAIEQASQSALQGGLANRVNFSAQGFIGDILFNLLTRQPAPCRCLDRTGTLPPPAGQTQLLF